MKNFASWGVRIRQNKDKNYYSVWNNLETVRLDLGETISLDPERSEFYDVGITERCNAWDYRDGDRVSGCAFCYVKADSTKQDYDNVCEIWKNWMDSFPEDKPLDFKNDEILKDILSKPTKYNTLEEVGFKLKTYSSLKKYDGCYTEKPFQIAIGSTGEPTIAEDFTKFLETVYNTKVVPNYTTNGIVIASDTKKSEEILNATSQFCGGVAVSFGNKSIRTQADKAIQKLLKYGDCKVMIHELIGTKEDVDELISLNDKYGKDIHYHVLLPLMKHGRSKTGMNNETYLYLINKVNKLGLTNLAFGANFAPFMKNNELTPNVWEYPQECYSKNILLKDKVIITPSSYNLNPIN